MDRLRRTIGLFLVLALSAMTVVAVGAQELTPSVTVEDQAIEDDTVTIASAVSDGPGWMVIHADDDGAPGPVIGYAALTDGENTDIVVEIDTEMATETLHAMLHEDAGVEGTYEFPGDDGPVTVDDEVVMAPFTITGGLMEEAEEAEVEAEAEEAEEEAEEPMMPASGSVAWLWTLVPVLAGIAMVVLGVRFARQRANH